MDYLTQNKIRRDVKESFKSNSRDRDCHLQRKNNKLA